jgi:putative flippase GtrA
MHSQKIKLIIFGLIGVFNTLFDIAVYTVIVEVEHSIILANIVSTSLALIGSYFLNSRLTFKSKKWTTRSFVLFVIVTLFGLWVLQTVAIYLIVHLLHNSMLHSWSLFGRYSHVVQQVVPKLLATGITLVWNYLWYSKAIFRQSNREENVLLALDEL